MTRKYVIHVNNKKYEVEVTEVERTPSPPLSAVPSPPPVAARPVLVPVAQTKPPPSSLTLQRNEGNSQGSVVAGLKIVQAPMTGTIIKILCQEGQEVNEGDVILKLEAMKMETEMAAPYPGRIKEIRVKERQSVTAGDTLVVME